MDNTHDERLVLRVPVSSMAIVPACETLDLMNLFHACEFLHVGYE